MKRIHPYIVLLLAGLSAGLFWYACQFPVMRFYSEKHISFFGNARYTTFLLKYISSVFGCLAAVWLTYSFWLSRWTGKSFWAVLRMDALSYMPVCLLALIAIPSGEFRLLRQAVTILQLGHQALFLCAFAGVGYVKIRQYAFWMPVSRRKVWWGEGLPPTWKQVAAIFLASLCIYFIVSTRLFTHLSLGGDEPHYLLISHSLLHDRDLAITNNYTQEDYRIFFPGVLKRHVTLGKDQTRYPGHPIGLSVLLLPFYALGGRFGALVFMNASAALLVTQLYLLAFAVTQNRKRALLLWGLCSFSTPLWIYSSQIYPEIPSALCFATAYRLLIFPLDSGTAVHRRDSSGGRLWLIGITLAILPWLQQRMILAATLLMAYYILSSGLPAKLWNWKRAPFRWGLLVPVALFALSGFSLMAYYWILYGNPMPNAPYRSIGWTTLFSWSIFLKQGMLGLWLDQEAGLFMTAPHYILIVPGLWLILRRNWRQALGTVALILSIYVTCAGYIDSWRGGWSPAARYMVALTPLLLPLLAEALAYLRSLSFKVATTFLIALSAWWSYIFFQIPTRSLMRGIGINGVLEYFRTPIVDPSLYFPSFVLRSNSQYIVTALWFVFILGFAVRYVQAAHRLTPSEGTPLRKLVGVYGIGVLILLVLTWGTGQIPGHERQMNAAKNTHIHDFLQHLNHDAILVGSLPVTDTDIQFEYGSRPKRGLVAQHGPHSLVSGPYEFYPKGKYRATFSLRVSDNSLAEPIVILDVVADHGSRIFAAKALQGRDFAQIEEPVDIQIPFELLEDVANLETRVYFLDRADVQVEEVTVRPDFVDFYYRTGSRALVIGDKELALTTFSDATTSGTRHTKLLYQFGALLQDFGLWERSVNVLQCAISASPDFADAHYRLGLARQHAGNWQLAQTSIEQAATLLPTHLDAWHALYDVYDHLRLRQLADDAKATTNLLSAWQFPYFVNFANQITFLGYHVEQVEPGKLRMHYFWKALMPIARDYVIFVHFTDGNTTFQQDHDPHSWEPEREEQHYYPTSQWQVGEVIHEQFDINAPSGTFAVTLGVWDPMGSGKRLPITTQRSWKEMLRNYILLKENIHIP